MDGDAKLAISMVLTTINVGLLNLTGRGHTLNYTTTQYKGMKVKHSMSHKHQNAILIDHINQKII